MQSFRQVIMRNREMKRREDTIARVLQMEQSFDEITEVVRMNPELLQNDESMKEKVQELIAYYESGLWLQDYESDERGELPRELKRGVLSEDGLYNLLSDIKNMDE